MQWVRPDARDDAHGLVADASGSLWYVHPPRGAVPLAALQAAGIPAELVLRASRGPVRLLTGHTAAVEGVRFGTVSRGPLAVALSPTTAAAATRKLGGEGDSPPRGAGGAGAVDTSALVAPAIPATFLVSVGGEDGSMRVWNSTPTGGCTIPLTRAQQRVPAAAAASSSPGRLAPSAARAAAEATDASSAGDGASSAHWDAGLDQLMLVQSAGGHVATAVAVSVPGTASAAHSDGRHVAAAPAAVGADRGRSSGGAAGAASKSAALAGRIAVGFDNGAVRVFLIESLKEEGRFKPHEPQRSTAAGPADASSGSGTGTGGSAAVSAVESATSPTRVALPPPPLPPSEICALAWASFPVPVHPAQGHGVAPGRARVVTALRDVACLVSGDRLGRVFVTVLQGGVGAAPASPLLGRAAAKTPPLAARSFSLADLAARSRLDGLDVRALFDGRPVASISASPADPALFLVVGASGAVSVWRLISSGTPSQAASAGGSDLEPRVVLLALLSANPQLTRGLRAQLSEANGTGGGVGDQAASGAPRGLSRRSCSGGVPVVVVDVARVALRIALLSSLAEAAVTQPSPAAYGEPLVQQAGRASLDTGRGGASVGATSAMSGTSRGSAPGGAVLAEFSPASPSVVAVLVPVPMAALPPASLAALQSRGQAIVGQALLFFDFGAGGGRVLYCTPPLPQVVSCMAPLPAWPAEHAELVAASDAAGLAFAAAAASRAAGSARVGGTGSARSRSHSLFSNSGSTAARVREAVGGGGLDVLLDDASVASDDPDSLPVNGAEVASAVALELAAGGGFVFGTVTEPQLLVVGAGGAARGQILAFSDLLEASVTSVDVAFSRLVPPEATRVDAASAANGTAALRLLRPRWLRAFSAVCGKALQLLGMAEASTAP